MDGKMEELVDLPVMAPILGICRLAPSGQLSDLHGFKKLYLSAKVPGMGKFSSVFFALALEDSGLEPPGCARRRRRGGRGGRRWTGWSSSCGRWSTRPRGPRHPQRPACRPPWTPKTKRATRPVPRPVQGVVIGRGDRDHDELHPGLAVCTARAASTLEETTLTETPMLTSTWRRRRGTRPGAQVSVPAVLPKYRPLALATPSTRSSVTAFLPGPSGNVAVLLLLARDHPLPAPLLPLSDCLLRPLSCSHPGTAIVT